MVGLGQGERAERLDGREGAQPPRLLLRAPEERERAEGQTSLHPEDRAQ